MCESRPYLAAAPPAVGIAASTIKEGFSSVHCSQAASMCHS